VIEIDEEDYRAIKNIKVVGDLTIPYVLDAIREGTPLPKGHGELKGIGKCDRKLFYQRCGGANSLITVKTAFDMLLALPTIIEADKEGEEE